MPIDYEQQTDDGPVVREGNGWRQTTGSSRTYEDCAPSDDRWEATSEPFVSMTTALRAGFPTDFSNAAVYNVVDESIANWDHLCSLHPTERTSADFGEDKPSRRDQMVAYRDVSLNRAADRGTGAHSYMEARLRGEEIDWDRVASMGSLPWLAAIENFLDREQPEPFLMETVAFDRDWMVAGTVDALIRFRGVLWEIDWKTRAQKSKRHFTHARRPKEAAQLGGYHRMLTQGYYMDARGRRQQVTDGLMVAVVTFGADGSYAIHEVDARAAEEAYDTAMAMRERTKISFLMPAKPNYSEDFDPNPLLVLSIDNVPDDAPEKMALAKAWQDAGLGKPSRGEVEAARYGEAMHLIYRHTATHQPFTAESQPLVIVPEHVVGELAERMHALPSDIAEEAKRNAAGLPPLSSLRITEADVEDWDRVLQIAETTHRKRQQEAIRLHNILRDSAAREPLMALMPDDMTRWTDRQLTIATAIISAAHTSEIVVAQGAKCGASEQSTVTQLDLHGTKSAVKKLAREKASEYGLEAPSKWDDLIADPVLWAVLVSA